MTTTTFHRCGIITVGGGGGGRGGDHRVAEQFHCNGRRRGAQISGGLGEVAVHKL